MEVLLATLLIMPGRVISIDQLIAEIWPVSPPRRATAALHVYISQLRKFLDRPGLANPIVTRSPGYLFLFGDAETDLQNFQDLMAQGRDHVRAARHEAAVTCLQSALRLWRGSALSELRDGTIIRTFTAWLDQVRLECIEMLVSSSLMLGRHGEITPFLYSQLAEHPFNETFYQQLMVALYRSGRRAEALKVYMAARDSLQKELGLEPCRALRDLQHTILTAEEASAPVGSVPEARNWALASPAAVPITLL
jgi:DNA-binding SARP family transcriptional activator